MAEIPLNYFVRKVYPLTTSLSALYTAPFNRAAIILAAYATNNTASDVTVTVGFSGVGGNVGGQQTINPKPYYNYAKDLCWNVLYNSSYDLLKDRIKQL